MKPLELRLESFRSYRELVFSFPDGLAALVGENGTGKSSLVSAVDVGLFGPEGRSLAPYVSTDADGDMVICLTFEHAGDTYRVRRTFSPAGRGKSATDFELMVNDLGAFNGWHPLSRESQDETQAEIERVLGFTRETFRASSFLAQGAGAAFCEAQPQARKRILGDVLALPRWDDLLELTRARKRDQEQRAAALTANIARADTELGEQERTSLALQSAADTADRESVTLAEAETLLAKVTERYREAAGRVEARQRANEALQAALAGFERQRHAEFQAVIAEWRSRAAERNRLVQRARDVQADRQRLTTEADAYGARADQALAAAVSLEGGQAQECKLCGTVLVDDARERAKASYRAEAGELNDRATKTQAQIAALPNPAEFAKAAAEHDPGREPTIDTHDFGEALHTSQHVIDQARAALDALPAIDTAETERIQQDGLQARAAVEEHRRTLEQARAEKVRLETTLERLKAVADQRDTDQAEMTRVEGELALLALEERSRGRNGIPLLILENVVPEIETEANRILGDLGTAYRVELRTQAATKAGDLRDTLEVIVWTDTTDRPFESFSGGERTRIALALRIALARLLANRRGAESWLLAIDEPDGLDADGMAALVAVLRGLQDSFDVILVISHQQALQDAFDTVIQVERGPGGSRIVGDREPVAA